MPFDMFNPIGEYKFWKGDAEILIPKRIKKKTVDCIVTSPPYNLNVKYKTYKDNVPKTKYLTWFGRICEVLKTVLKDNGSFFLNVGFSSKDPWIDNDMANIARNTFAIQNKIIWVKSISVKEKSFGQFRPLTSDRYVNKTYETIYHFTKDGNIKLNRLAIGVPYEHPSNLTRWKTHKKETRCRGNCWFVPYKTVTRKKQEEDHPATFPIELPKMCIKLHGYNKKTIVLDPFVGTGATVLAAIGLGSKGIGIDIDGSYIEEAKKRIKRRINGIT